MALFLEMITSKVYPPQDSKSDFTGRTVMITGANTGVGFEAAIKFVQQGADKVVIAVRSADKGNAAKVDIEKRTGRNVVEVWELDMLNYDSIKAFARRFDADPTDIAILNAGVFVSKFEKSDYGWEKTLQVNLLSTVLLALLLIPSLQQNKTSDFTPVLEIINSGLHVYTTIENTQNDPLQAHNTPDKYDGQRQYGISKLFGMYAIQHMASSTSDLNILAVCPGATKSDLAREMSGPVLDIVKAAMYTTVFRTTEQGARSYVSGVLVGDKAHGRFWQHDKIQPQAPALIGEKGKAMQERVWKSVVEALKKDVPEVLDLMV